MHGPGVLIAATTLAALAARRTEALPSPRMCYMALRVRGCDGEETMGATAVHCVIAGVHQEKTLATPRPYREGREAPPPLPEEAEEMLGSEHPLR